MKREKSMSPCCRRCARSRQARNWSTRSTTSATSQPCLANIPARWNFPVRVLLPARRCRTRTAKRWPMTMPDWLFPMPAIITEAAAELDLGLKLTAETGNAQTAVLILNNLGIVYYYQAKYSESLRTYESALQYVEKSATEPWSRNVAADHTAESGNALSTAGQRSAGHQDLQRHSGPSRGIFVRATWAISTPIWARIYRRLGDAKQALKFYGYADEYYAKEKDVDGELGVLKNSGIVLALDLGRLPDALKTFDRVRAAGGENKKPA